MAKPKIITGLDIGSHSIKALAVSLRTGFDDLEILGFVETPSFGVRRGVVFDIERVSGKIAETLKQLQENIGQKIEDVYVNIGGSHIFAASSRGTVVVSRADRKISEEDVSRAIQAARVFPVPLNNEVLEIFPKEFIIDGHGQIKRPSEMEGVKLEAEVIALCAFSPYKSSLTSAVVNADLQIMDILPSSLASAWAVLTGQQKELGVCLLDIGGGTTSLAVYKEGDLAHAAVFPIGSSHITADLAVGLKTDIELAEQIKKEFGACITKSSNKKEKIETENNETLVFSQKALTGIITTRLNDIFDLTKEELKKVESLGLLPAGLVLTGGGAKLSRIAEFARKELKLPAKIGFPQNLPGAEKDPALSTVCGLVLAGCEARERGERFFSPLGGGIVGKIKNVFKIFNI